tara:strand:- start:495 stop:974 length:480 start_codon:yes stop_codon:yes gene_type:complete
MSELGSTNIDELIDDNFEQNEPKMNNVNIENVTTNETEVDQEVVNKILAELDDNEETDNDEIEYNLNDSINKLNIDKDSENIQDANETDYSDILEKFKLPVLVLIIVLLVNNTYVVKMLLNVKFLANVNNELNITGYVIIGLLIALLVFILNENVLPLL